MGKSPKAPDTGKGRGALSANRACLFQATSRICSVSPELADTETFIVATESESTSKSPGTSPNSLLTCWPWGFFPPLIANKF